MDRGFASTKIILPRAGGEGKSHGARDGRCGSCLSCSVSVVTTTSSWSGARWHRMLNTVSSDLKPIEVSAANTIIDATPACDARHWEKHASEAD